jgi:hypothetical protein
MMFLRYIRVLDLSRIILLKTNMNEPYLLHFKYLSGLKMTRSDCILTFVHSSTNDMMQLYISSHSNAPTT